jgi:protein-S-isoprenylcysteine O-methyltransferase Ste14
MAIPGQRRYRWRRRITFAIVLPAIILACVSRPLFGSTTPIALTMHFLGWLTFVGGSFFRLWATLYLGGRKSEVLVLEGPYSVCRHPLYVGTFLLGLTLGLLLESFVVVGAAIVAMVVYASGTIPSEERFMCERFGGDYRAYMERTPRFVPNVKGYHSPPSVEVSIAALRKELVGACGYMLIPLIDPVIELARQQPWWPNLLSLP